MRKILDTVYTAGCAAAALSLACLALIVLGQVMLNLLNAASAAFFGVSTSWLIPSYAAFSGYALGFATFLSLGLGFRKAVHIRITLLESRLSHTSRRASLVVVALLGTAMGGLFTVSLGQLAYESWTWGDTASGLVKVPLWIPQTVLLVGAAIFCLACIDTLVEMLKYGRSEAFNDDRPVEESIS